MKFETIFRLLKDKNTWGLAIIETAIISKLESSELTTEEGSAQFQYDGQPTYEIGISQVIKEEGTYNISGYLSNSTTVYKFEYEPLKHNFEITDSEKSIEVLDIE